MSATSPHLGARWPGTHVSLDALSWQGPMSAHPQHQEQMTPPAARPTAAVRSSVRFEISVRSILIVVAAVAAVWMLVHLVPALLVLVLSLMLVGALNPLVQWLEKRRMGRKV